jgi:hypothetical protein
MTNKIPTVYCIGPIDSSKDPRAAFDYVEKQLKELGHIVINPVKNEPGKTGMEVEDSLKHLRNLWRTGRTEEFVEVMKKIWIADLKAVHLADYLVLHFEEGDSGGGTFLEMTVASMQALLSLLASVSEPQEKAYIKSAKMCMNEAGLVKKPIYWVCQGATSDINTTLKFLVFISGGQVFSTYKELTEFLKKNYGKFEVETKEETKDAK